MLSLHRKSAVFSAVFWTAVSLISFPAQNAAETHVVKKGETLGSILAQNGVRKLWCSDCEVRRIAELNQLKNPNRLAIGQKIELAAEAERAISSTENTRSAESTETASQPTPQPSQPLEPLRPLQPSQTAISSPAVPAEPSADGKLFQSEVVFSVPLHTFEIQGTDKTDRTKGTLLGGLNPGVLLGWRLRFENDWETEVASRYESDAVQPDINSTHIEGREQKIGSISAHIRYGSTVRLGLDFESRDRLVYRAAPTVGVRVQTLPVRSLGMSIDARVFQAAGLSVRAGASYGENFIDANYGPGSSYAGRLILRHDFESWAIESELGYESSRYQTTILEVSGSDLWLSWGAVWKL